MATASQRNFYITSMRRSHNFALLWCDCSDFIHSWIFGCFSLTMKYVNIYIEICIMSVKTKGLFVTKSGHPQTHTSPEIIHQDKKIHREEYLQKRLLSFLHSHGATSLFWLDRASYHYAKDVLEWYEANGVHAVPKESNPPNCPELPIKQYWALVKRELSQCKQQVTTVDRVENQF